MNRTDRRFRTTYYGPTNFNGARVKVTDLQTGKSQSFPWDYSANLVTGAHKRAVQQFLMEKVGAGIVSVNLFREKETRSGRGYIFVWSTPAR